MQRWEYLILDCLLVSDTWRPWKMNGVEILNYQNLRVTPKINELGDIGWEMVGFGHSSGGTVEYWVFKRQK